MTTAVLENHVSRARTVLPLSLRLALRELRGGMTGFYVFIACIALGSMAIAAIGTLSAALQSATSREGGVLLGGDVEARLVHRQATGEERSFLASKGRVSEVATLRSMGRLLDGSSQALVQVKAVDGVYPLYGAAEFEDGKTLADIGRPGAVAVERALLEQLGLKIGDRFQLGTTTLEVVAVLAKEPDRLAAGPTLGLRVLMSLETLRATGLDQPGSLIDWRYRVRLAEGAVLTKDSLAHALPNSGFLVSDRSDPTPGMRQATSRLSEFLTLVGLTSLLTGGIGVANAVAAFVERKRKTIAVYKALGAPGWLITRSLLLQVLILALLGIVIGLVLGVALLYLLVSSYAASLPVRLDIGLYPVPLLQAAVYGLLIALIFILWPLGRARQIRAGELLRESTEGLHGLPPRAFAIGSMLCAVTLVGMAVFLSEQPRTAAMALVAVAAVFALFYGLGIGFRRLAAILPRSRRPELALAIANIAGPAGLTRTVTVSLGAGLTLLTIVAIVDTSMRNELATQIPERAPSYFFIGLTKAEFPRFAAFIAEKAPGSQLESAPMLRGQLVALANKPVAEIKAPSEAQWVLNGDRGITFSAKTPSDTKIVEGAWWGEDYAGEPLVSFEVEMGRALGLKIGDSLTVNVLGRNVTARIANFRTVKWNSFNINFLMIFSPNTLAAAPYSMLATLSWTSSSRQVEADTIRAVTAEFPTVSSVRIHDVLETVNKLLVQVFTAIRAAGSLTLISGVLVLAGALGTVRARRIYEAVILKTLGATRARIALAHLAEHLILGLAAAVAATGVGAAVAYVLLVKIMDIAFAGSLLALLQAALIAAVSMAAFGLIGTFRVLSAKAAPHLRAE